MIPGTFRACYAWCFRTLVLLGVLVGILAVAGPTSNVSAATGINQQMNFQGRLLNAQGAVVPDGYYNVQFKIYQDGAGTSVGNPGGTLVWTENYLGVNGQAVVVKNGFISVQLGSITALSAVDWTQDTLWLSMNIGSTSATCTPFSSCGGDGEMVPMKRLSASPYAMSAGSLEGKTAADFIQNTTTLQNANLAIQSAGASNIGFVLQGAASQTADIFQVKSAGGTSTLLSVKASGSTVLQPASDITEAFAVKNRATGLNVLTVDTQNTRVGVGTATPSATLHVATSTSSLATPTLLVDQQGTGNSTIGLKTATDTWYMGVDSNDGGTFKINSAASAATTSTFGNTSPGSTNDTGDNNLLNAGRFTASSSGTVVSLSVYMACTISPSPNNKFQMALYADNGSGTAPAGRLASTVTGNLVNGWNQLSLGSASVTSGTNYWIVYNTNGTGATSNCFRKTIGGGASVWSSTYTFGTMPASWPGTAGSGTDNASFYATVQTSTLSDTYSESLFQMTSSGRTTLQNSLDSTNAFQIQNAAGATVLNADTTNSRVGIALASGEVNNFDLGFGGGANRTIGINQTTSAGTGRTLTIQGGQGNTGAGGGLTLLGGAASGAFAGGTATLQGGPASATAGSAGGSVVVAGAAGSATGAGGNGGAVTINGGGAGGTGATNGGSITIAAGGVTTGTGAAGTVTIQGGSAAGTRNGGNLTLSGGTATGTGSNGLVVLSTSAFQTLTNDSGCFTGGTEVAASCNISAAAINNNASVIVGFTNDGQTAFMPDPTIVTAGRIVYVTASNLSKDFTLSVNGGGQGNQIAMRKNTTATMIWNGSDWTAAGASSSTTMQAAYDNTLQSAGGAELVVSKTSATNGLTIRDSTVNSVDGTLLSVQTKSAAGLFQVNSNVTEYVSNAGAETAGASATTFPASTWSAIGASTVSRNITTTNNSIATGQASVGVTTPATAQVGVKNTLTTALGTSQNYNVSFAARLASGTFTDLNVYYSVDGTTASVPCVASQAIATSIWTKINCAFTAPASGITASNAIFIRQTTGTARTFYVDNLSVTIAADYNYATDGTVSDGTNFATNWSSVAGATVSRTTSTGNDASDSAQVVTTATAGQGARNKLSISPLPSTLYRITVYAASSNSFNDFTIRYSRDGGTSFVACADYNTQTVSTVLTSFTKVTCYVTTDATAATNPYVYFTQTAGTARTFYVDTFEMNLSSATTPNVQIGGGSNGGPTTLFTLDRGASAPIASNNDALLGSMYYDTSLGKLQCYEADGWGACGSSPDNIITISPEYTNAVLHGTGIGTMTSDLCSSTLSINDGSSGQATICGSGETYNFYKWTSPQASAQTYSIYVTYQLPGTFKEFNSGQTSLMGRTDNGSSGGSATVAYQIYRNSGSGLVSCGTSTLVSTGTVSSWQVKTASGAADPSTCGFAPGNSIVFKIDVTTSKNANAYVGNLNFAFSNK